VREEGEGGGEEINGRRNEKSGGRGSFSATSLLSSHGLSNKVYNFKVYTSQSL
jgi:hypothetical protein